MKSYRKACYFLFLVLVCTVTLKAQSKIESKENQIKAAISPAPDEIQRGATVKGYDETGRLTLLRKGTNNLICLADDPEQSNFHVVCYHRDLEPFMRRGRDLKQKGMSMKEIDSIRKQEIKEGSLAFPKKPMALYSLTGSEDSFNYTTGQVTNASPLYVIYIPYATESSTGLSQSPVSKGAPWIMEPGTPWAHIMVMTGREIGRAGGVKN